MVAKKVESIDDLWISNAAYFLKEHMIYLTHIESMSKAYIRLIGPNFSGLFDEMIKSLQETFKISKQNIDIKNTKEKTLCVGFNKRTNLYNRLLIIKKESPKV